MFVCVCVRGGWGGGGVVEVSIKWLVSDQNQMRMPLIKLWIVRFQLALQQNAIMNVFYDDWVNLGEADDAFGSKADSHLKVSTLPFSGFCCSFPLRPGTRITSLIREEEIYGLKSRLAKYIV